MATERDVSNPETSFALQVVPIKLGRGLELTSLVMTFPIEYTFPEPLSDMYSKVVLMKNH